MRSRIRASHGARIIITVTAVLAVLAGCAWEEKTSPEGPVTDIELLAQIRDLDHVVDAKLEYNTTAINGDSYSAFVTVDAGVEVDSYCLMDQVAAILWMGRQTAMKIAVEKEGAAQGVYDDHTDVGPDMWVLEGSLTKRYGPRPEPGSDPTPAPAPACE